mmetsp:Transcript_151231/g.466451  ORF Transcript_151231/g.466451 Transcript_151231/m.466451 type:complete len:210 (+) Transcript_151231:319-948(+)
MKPTEHSWLGSENILRKIDEPETFARITYAAGGSSTRLPSSFMRSTGSAWRLLQSLRTSRARAVTMPTADGGAEMRLVPESTMAPQEDVQALTPAPPARPGTSTSVILTPQCSFPTTRSVWKLALDRGRVCVLGPTESQPGAPAPRSKQKAKLLICIAESMESASDTWPPMSGTCPGWPKPTMPEKCALWFQTAMLWLTTCQKGVRAAA